MGPIHNTDTRYAPRFLHFIPKKSQIIFLGFLFTASASAQARPSTKANVRAKTKIKRSIALSVFGDSGYISSLNTVQTANLSAVETNLKRLTPLRSQDLNFLNLEGALSWRCHKFADKSFPFVIRPDTFAVFSQWGFNLIGMANNHSLDCLKPSPAHYLKKSLSWVRRHLPNVAFHGVAPTYESLLKPAIKNIHGLKIGMISVKAWKNHPKALVGNRASFTHLAKSLKKAPADIRILSLHGGAERSRTPSPEMIALARSFINDYRGDLVIGHHAHVYQGLEIIKKSSGRTAVIFYGLGNSLHNGLSIHGDGIVGRLRLSAKGIQPNSLEVFPLASPSKSPRPLSTWEFQKFKRTFDQINHSNLAAGVKNGLFPASAVTRRQTFLGLKIFPLRHRPMVSESPSKRSPRWVKGKSKSISR